MIIIPDKLLKQDFTEVFYQSPQAILMKKSLPASLEGREAYLSMHAMSMVVAGSQTIRTYEGEVSVVKEGEFALVRKGIYTINDLISQNQGFRSYLFYFEEGLLENFLDSDVPNPKSSYSNPKLSALKQPDYLSQFWKSIEGLSQSFPQNSHKIFPIKIQELLAILTASYPNFSDMLLSLKQIKQSQEKSLKAFMEKHFDKPLTIEDYAYLTGRSESTFRREFKSKYAITPRKWIIQRRMQKAVQLLSSTPWEVGRIAVEVGYENTSHFIAEFKKQYGFTPSQYGHNNKLSLQNP